ncbi:MotA/TolQ/ExbB proton channel family protein [Solitalea canadensis]|uniref:Biopolymer transport protein n=1 Tax=Solitalea canadensis (strain ATCC 29591 / DSM 3403 / JCM 21819 / LMG 8368 / NBRC 15130 / NCIMB 12057 / USAM 9D) TaxID=929556 RepID=H8KMF2_SOLCM|nr:MotA/TolQ/ExbB proton channel family protein [Solitalea canadensis]AFD08747.1 biopolymer transport protein [Solitalea canadensis DSM 3403]
MANAAQQTAKKVENAKFNSNFAAWVIPTCIAVGILIYIFVLGNPSNFEGGVVGGHPIAEGAGHYLGLVYMGGYVVPILLSLVLINLTVAIERLITISAASGKGSAQAFVSKIRSLLGAGNVDAAIKECDIQKGSVANVVKSTLVKYKEMENEAGLDVDQRILAIQKEIEESTTLELPMLEKNLVITATLASVSTLFALLGTVLGMIKAFSALGNSGAPDSAALAVGISEALINTALGIGNSALATVFYAYFTTRIDTITYAIDEAGYSIIQTFAAKHK